MYVHINVYAYACAVGLIFIPYSVKRHSSTYIAFAFFFFYLSLLWAIICKWMRHLRTYMLAFVSRKKPNKEEDEHILLIRKHLAIRLSCGCGCRLLIYNLLTHWWQLPNRNKCIHIHTSTFLLTNCIIKLNLLPLICTANA